MPDKRSRSSESCNVGTPCSRGPGAIAAKRFRTAAQCDGDAVGEIRPIRHLRFEQRLHIAPHLLGLLRANHARNTQRRHQPHGADRNLRVLLDGVIVQDVDFEAAAAEIDDAARRRLGAHHRDGRFASEPRFFRAADHLERDAGLPLDFAHERFAIARFTRRAGRHRAITRDAVFVHHFLEVTKRLHAFFKNVFGETVTEKNTFAEAQRVAFAVERFDVESGIGARDGKAHCVGAGVDRRDVNWLGHASEFNARDVATRTTERILSRGFRGVRRCAAATVCSRRRRWLRHRVR